MDCSKARSKVERIGKEICQLNVLPFIFYSVVALYVDLFMLGDAEAVNIVFKAASRLMWFSGVQT